MAARRYPHPMPDREGLGESISGLAEDTAKLFRLELDLLRQEIMAMVRRNAIAVGMLVGAGVSAFVFLIFVQVLLIVAIPAHWLVALILTLIWLAAAVILAYFGKSRLRIAPPEATIQSLKEDLEWVRTLVKPAPR